MTRAALAAQAVLYMASKFQSLNDEPTLDWMIPPTFGE
jgi:hypothetical protein